MNAEATDQEGRQRVPIIVPLLVASALFMEMLDATIVNTAVPSIAAALDVAPLSVKSVLTSYTLSLAVFIPISGWMADRFGTRAVFAAAIAVFTLGSILCGAAFNIHSLVAARVLQGMGGAMMTPVGRLALVRTFPRDQIISVMNYVIVPSLLGPLFGPLAGGVIVHFLPWRMIFLLNVPLGIAGVVLVLRYMPDYRGPRRPMDVTGLLLFGAGIGLLSYVLEIFGEHRWGVAPMTTMTAISIIFLLGYGLHARRVAAPLLRLELFRTRTFSVSVLGGFVTRLGIGGMPFLLPLLYQVGLGYTPWQSGLLLMPQALAALVTKPIAQRILARFGHRTVLIVNTVLIAGTISLFAIVGPETSIAVIVGLGFLQGCFSSIQFTSMNSLVYADIDDTDASSASSIASTAQQLSMSFGVALASLVVAVLLGAALSSERSRLIPALHEGFHVLGLVTALSSATFLSLKPTDGDNVSHHNEKRASDEEKRARDERRASDEEKRASDEGRANAEGLARSQG